MNKITYLSKLLCLTIIIVLPGCIPAGQPKHTCEDILEYASPGSAGFSGERLVRIDELFRDLIEQEYIAGATAILVRNGKIVYHKASGYNNPATGERLERDAIFRIASQTKAITSVAVLMLYEEGKFSLDDAISEYIPELAGPGVLETFDPADSSFTTVKADREVSIRDLLRHTSGYGYVGSLPPDISSIYSKFGIGSMFASDNTLEEEIMKLEGLPLAHQPGKKYTYGISTDILGYLVERISGMSLAEFFRVRIFEPLGMVDSYFYLPERKYGRLMNLHAEKKGGGLYVLKPSGGWNPDYPISGKNLYSGGGGLSSTAYDYAIFMQMILNGGCYDGKRFLSESTIRMMTVNQIGDIGSGSLFIPGGPDKFGLGFEIISSPGSIKIPINEGSFGWGGAFGSLYWIDPVENLSAHLVIQKRGNYGQVRAKFITAVYQAMERQSQIPPG